MLSAFSLGMYWIFILKLYYAEVFSVISRIIFSFQMAFGMAEYILSPSISLHSSSLSPYSLITGTSTLLAFKSSEAIYSHSSTCRNAIQVHVPCFHYRRSRRDGRPYFFLHIVNSDSLPLYYRKDRLGN